MRHRPLLLLSFVLMLLLYSCSSTKYVPENDFLLDKVIIQSSDKTVKSGDLKQFLKQSPNLKIFGFFKFHLGVYNLSGKDNKHWYDRWLKRIGEEPVLYDSFLKEKSRAELTKHLMNKGYLDVIVHDTVINSKKKKTTLIFDVALGQGYSIESHHVKIEDPLLELLVQNDSTKTLIKSGNSFDIDVFDQERDRITTLLKKEGYFKFSKEYIHFLVDSTDLNREIRDTLKITNPSFINELGEKAESLHTRYTIRNTYFITDYNPQEALKQQEAYYETFDTIIVEGHHFLFHEKQNIKPIIFLLNNLIQPGDPYNIAKVERTNALLSSIPIVRYVDIRFFEAGDEIDPMLDCIIQITPSKKHVPLFDIEATHQDGYFGAAVNMNYQHRNLFKGAELLNLKLRLARESQKAIGDDGSSNIQDNTSFNSDELGLETSLLYPQFLFPLLSRKFKENFKSSTTFGASYNYQIRPDYTRVISNLAMNYKWKGRSSWNHSLDIIDFNFVDIRDMSENFSDYIDDIFLQYSYEDHVIHSINYSISYNNQNQRNFRDTRYLRLGIESAGNTLYGVNSLLKSSKPDKAYEFLGIKFSQYIKFDGEGTYNQYINEKNTIAYHGTLGVAYPYGNLDVMPFEKRYFGGGANGIRGWQVRSLGPGSYYPEKLNYMNQSGDIKLQMNAEYRFKLFWVLEGALFVDAGNIWTIRDYPSQGNGTFKFDTFYNQIALAYGLGTRFDFNFFVFRLDWGIKGLDPTSGNAHHWVGNPFPDKDYAFHLAIGYPF